MTQYAVAPEATRNYAAPSGSRKQLVDFLVHQGVVTPQQLEIARQQMRDNGDGKGTIGNVLVRLGYATEEDLTRARAAQLGIAYARPEEYCADAGIPAEVLGAIPAQIAHQYNVLPLGRSVDGRSLRVVSNHWINSSFEVVKQLAVELGLRVEPVLGTERDIVLALRSYYPGIQRVETTMPVKTNPHVPAVVDQHSAPPVKVAPPSVRASDVLSASSGSGQISQVSKNIKMEFNEDVDIQEFSIDQPVIIQFVNKIIADAINKKASDIHFEPGRDRLEIKYRIDGALHHVDEVPKSFQAACASRLKVMAEMNIAERRVPQDGRISVRTGGRIVDMRVSSMPTQYGEAVVLRILDRTMMRLDVNHLGFSERNLRTLKTMISKPHGIILATGPTGSGKTTTLYASLQAIKTPDINIITVEDPIEYELDGVRQSSINEKAGLTFARQLRAILRQDPDVIYIGEIRDTETAEIAFRAALTGHLVLSTLHCNDAAGAITRLLNMGMDPFLIASSVIGMMAQRLVRKVCTECGVRYEPRPEELKAFGVDPKVEDISKATFLRGIGCPKCDMTGYSGRYSVQELMVMDETVRQLTLERETATRIRQAACTLSSNPMIPMRRDGADKVMQGITTFEEVQRRVYIEEE